MDNFTISYLRVTAVAETVVVLNEHKGSAIRGALFHALRGPMRPARDGYMGYCANKQAPSCWDCMLHQACPVSTLVSTLDSRSRQGRYVARPYVIHPPLDGGKRVYAPGERFSFELALCAEALMLFPYVVLALERLAHEGLGKKVEENGWRRGRLQIESIEAFHPLRGERQLIRAAGDRMAQFPDLPVTHGEVLAVAASLPTRGPLGLHFYTPMRLIHQGRLLKVPDFRVLLHRLITRLEELSGRFSDTPLDLEVPPLLAMAEEVRLVENETRWVELESYSARQGRRTPVGGLMGEVVFEAEDWGPFLPWLIWGCLVGVGKNTVKGDGWFGLGA